MGSWYLFLFPLGVALFGYHRHLLTWGGAVWGFWLGVPIIYSSVERAIQVIGFFLIGSAATKFKEKVKEGLMPFPEKLNEWSRQRQQPQQNLNQNHHQQEKNHGHSHSHKESAHSHGHTKKGRDEYQVLATAGIPTLLCLLAPPFGFSIFSFSATTILYRAYLACCCGDTLASEIGMLSKQQPHQLISRKLVTTGVDGGVTLLGTFASFIGGALMGSVSGELWLIWCCGCYGVIGSVFDSMLGELLQAHLFQYADKNSPHFLKSAKEWKRLNNLVNFISSLLMAITALFIHVYFVNGVWLLSAATAIAFIAAGPIDPEQEQQEQEGKDEEESDE